MVSNGSTGRPERTTATGEPQDAVPEGWRNRQAHADHDPEPEDAPPQPAPEPEDARPAPEPEPESEPDRPNRRWRTLAVLICLTAAVALVVTLLLPGEPSGDRPAATPSATPSSQAPRPDLTTPDRVRALVADLKRRTGDTKVVFFHVSAGYASATVPVPGDTSDKPFEDHNYQSGRGWSSYRSHGGSDGDERIPADLSKIDWDMLDELYPKVNEKLALPGSPARTLSLKAGLDGDRYDLPFKVRDSPAELSVELNDGTQVGWVEAGTDGTITEVHLPVQYAFSPRPTAGSPTATGD